MHSVNREFENSVLSESNWALAQRLAKAQRKHHRRCQRYNDNLTIYGDLSVSSRHIAFMRTEILRRIATESGRNPGHKGEA
jgi:hypothetical protein